MISGTCLCGVLRYELDGPLQGLLHCHCSRCRKHHGAPFASFTRVAEHQLRWLSGQDQLIEGPAAGRTRRSCQGCGAVAPVELGEELLVPAGNLQGELGLSGGEHMFAGSRPEWHVLADGLPQHEAAPPGWTAEAERPTVPGGPLPVMEGVVPGSCLCGAVTFAMSGAPARWMQCHCSRCRRARSAAHGSNMFYPAAQFSWRSGRELVRSYRPPEAARFTTSFCSLCGGAAPTERENVPFVLVPAALLDMSPGGRPEAYIFVASKAEWFTVPDDMPQFAELPPR